MNSTQYTPGDWRGIVARNHVALLPPETSDEVIERLWESMQEGEDLMHQLMIITEGRFSGLGPFALARKDGAHLHLLLRGAIEVTVEQGGESLDYSAPAVSTWLEQILDDVTSVQFSVAPSGTTSGDVREELGSYPILGGVIPAAFLQVGSSETPSRKKRRRARPGTQHSPVPPPPNAEPPQNETGDAHSQAAPDSQPDPQADSVAAGAPESVPAQQKNGLTPPQRPPTAAAATSEQPIVVPAALDEDHDGMTVMNSDVVSMRRRLPAWEGGAVPGPLVDPAERTAVPKIVLSTGMAVALDRPILLGRAPQVARVKNDEMPRLITVESPNHDISRTHAEVRMVGNEIVVTDLNSTNGVLLTRPGAVGERLPANEPIAVEAGAIVDLGEGVTFVVGRQT